ncbi:SRPBCC family protein [Flavobacterium sp.]|uniref:SRPBCC family protein n=1 Tax=Flavobacterium sp. TaxID=239 RepID=UPI003D0D12D9
MATIYHDFWIAAPAETIFDAVSTPYGLNDWWTQKCTGKCEIGAVYHLFFTEEYNWRAEITLLTHNEAIEFKMIKASEDWLPTSFGFILKEERPNFTKVAFYHKDWQAYSQEYRIANFCWGSLLKQLKQYLEKGIVTPFEERD